ncbi:putative oxidoreductase YciK [Streptomyces malaysiensis subsp. malaysiensis]|uniref:SDR family NAD(P)-dependent oxidoreductase n=1 Tax=Streptomyces malaysiensis TaxID=92644 RepID=UPI000CA25272|nr:MULTISPECIES: SDR family NAD(P)-dependent oxidoreductase [unclassified Streptomyces]AUA16664.1 putative oxidoreductase YciK [Streptomyces sp. M56]
MAPGKTIVITGASDGIGAAAARQLHRSGHRVVVVGRSSHKTRAVADEIGADSYVADFTRLDEVRALAARLDAAYPRIDVLANNAGGVFGDPARTPDGFEKTFQVNHLAPFLLTRLLMDKLLASGASVLQTSSVGARMAGKLDTDDLAGRGPPGRRLGIRRLLREAQARPAHQPPGRRCRVGPPTVGSLGGAAGLNSSSRRGGRTAGPVSVAPSRAPATSTKFAMAAPWRSHTTTAPETSSRYTS